MSGPVDAEPLKEAIHAALDIMSIEEAVDPEATVPMRLLIKSQQMHAECIDLISDMSQEICTLRAEVSRLKTSSSTNERNYQ